MCRNHQKAFFPWPARMGLWPLIPLFCSSAAQAASTLNFPRLSFESATLTGLAIVNPNDQSADVTLTAYNEDGSVLGVNQEPICPRPPPPSSSPRSASTAATPPN